MKNYLVLISIVIVAVLTSGCATHPGVVQSPPSVIAPPGKAKLVITRSTDAMFLGVQARIDVNGERVAKLWRGESYAAVLESGKVVLSTDAWSTPGRFLGYFNAEPDMEYTFEVAPRSDHMGTLMLSGIAGSALDSAINENTGPFSIELIEIKSLR